MTALWLGPALLVCKVAPCLSERLLRGCATRQLRIFGVRVKVTDRNDGRYGSPPYLYVLLNQTSLIETFIIQHSLPTPFNVLTNIEYALLPFVGWIVWLSGGVVIVRQWARQARRGVEKAAERMRSGRNFYMSIEGIRTPTPGLNPYKKGAVVLAIKARATIVPIVIHGAREILPYGEWRVRPGEVEVILCPAVPTSDLIYEDRNDLVGRLRLVAESELASSTLYS